MPGQEQRRFFVSGVVLEPRFLYRGFVRFAFCGATFKPGLNSDASGQRSVASPGGLRWRLFCRGGALAARLGLGGTKSDLAPSAPSEGRLGVALGRERPESRPSGEGSRPGARPDGEETSVKQ
jgi:hypothetical protein